MIASAPTIAYIGLGSNLGDRRGTIDQAVEMLGQLPQIAVSKVSDLVETEAVGGPVDQGKYLNGAAQLQCGVAAEVLLSRLQEIEQRLGRTRRKKWGSRTIDLDLLLFGGEIIDRAGLKVPHPLMTERLFVMVPMAQIAPETVHPILGQTMRQIGDMLEQRCQKSD